MDFEDKKVDNNAVTFKKISWLHTAVICFILFLCIWLLILLLRGDVKEVDCVRFDLLIRTAGILLGVMSSQAFLVKSQLDIYHDTTWSWFEIALGLIASIIFMLRGITFFIMIVSIIR